ncbi:CO or xanthine dehydrogenase, Mo-binding subunit [Rhodospirillales bacterium URHD0017]|nr:CO or xanthine dehydrogenase, Mo-binding subunit [Rhodospirillales bacterium URHD0017]
MNKALSRRGFVRAGVASGVAYKIGFIGSGAEAAIVDDPRAQLASWIAPDGKARFRTDAVAKVTGAKTFARDYRARDMPGWPAGQSHAFLIHATRADAVFTGIDLSLLGELKPDRLVLGDELLRDGLRPPTGGVVGAPGFYGEVFLVPPGETPRLLGQPLALLVYRDFARCDAARRRLRFAPEAVRWGAASGYNTPANYGAARFVRIAGPTPQAPDIYAPLSGTTIYADFKGDTVAWPSADQAGDASQRGMWAAGEIDRMIASAGSDSLVVKRSYFSQSADASAMEADNGNAWLDPASGALRMMMATQSPYEIAVAAASMIAASGPAVKSAVKSIDLSIGYTVGYGTKDHSIFPYLAIVAALYGEGRPVRLANDRYGQFQMALKRHSCATDVTLVVDRATQRFRLMKGTYRMDGGGRRNLSPEVSMVGASAAQGIYYLPNSDFTAEARASRAVDAGSTRGYGTLQTMAPTEMLVDEVAELLSVDPIELRRRNLMLTGMRNSQGAVPAGAIRTDELLQRAGAHPLWRERASRKRAYETAYPGRRYGVGFAIVQKDYGSGGEASTATLELLASGGLALRQGGSEIGTGLTTSHAVMVRDILGRAPDRMSFGVTEWPEMPLTSTEEPFTASQEQEDTWARDPRWTPMRQTAMSASNSVYFVGHATRTAARTLLSLSLWPAALSIWSAGPDGGSLRSLSVDIGEARFTTDGKLSAGGLEPLSLERLAAAARARGLVTAVSVHAFNRWEWAVAEFDVPGAGRLSLPADALSVRYGDGGYTFIERQKVVYPPLARLNAAVTYYSGKAALAEIAVDTATGKVEVLSHHSILECGHQVVPQLVSGQIQGGVAMGIGHALLESLPLYEGGPGDGTWNWNRYRLPHAADVAVWKQSAEVLPPLSDSDAPKGMAEVVMIPIVPAIANAIAHAIGKRFYATPITAEQILEALG